MKYALDAMNKTSRELEKSFNPNFDIPVVNATMSKPQLENLSATAKITPVLNSGSSFEIEKESTLETALKLNNNDIISTLI